MKQFVLLLLSLWFALELNVVKINVLVLPMSLAEQVGNVLSILINKGHIWFVKNRHIASVWKLLMSVCVLPPNCLLYYVSWLDSVKNVHR